LCDRNTALLEAPPYVCNCIRWPVIPLKAVELDLYNPNPADSWSNTGWEDFADHYKDAENEWSSVCGEIWTGNTASWVRGFSEPSDDRVTLHSYYYYFLDISAQMAFTRSLALRRMPVFQNVLTTHDFCDPSVQFLGGINAVPTDCNVWQANNATNPKLINVHWVGALFEDGDEINPVTGPRGIANPISAFGSTQGMVVVTDNPFVGARRRFTSDTGCWGDTYTDTQSWIHRYYWPTIRFDEAVPNLLSHELHHVLTGHAHTAQEPCNSIGIGSPTTQCPRGFNMRLGPDRLASSECAVVRDGIAGNDYTN
jgi:hypothetical protein